MRTSLFFGFLFLSIIHFSCKKEQSSEFKLRGIVRDATNGAPIDGLNVKIRQQEVAGGSFNGTFQEVTSTPTNSQGIYEATWEKKNIVSVEVVTSKELWIPATLEISASKFQPGKTVYQDISVYPEAVINVGVTRVSNDWNAFNFRFENAFFDCNCCDNDWKNLNSSQNDSTFTCRAYGDTWLKYRYELISPGQDSLVKDSIFLERFTNSSIQINW